VRRASARATVPLTPAETVELWSDVERWPSFVEGFARRLELHEPWPEPGGRVVWESTPTGRGRVTETVVERTPDRFSTQVYESALAGTQTLRAVAAGEGSEVELSLEYELARYGPLRGLADAIFIRRALRDSLRRTLYRFGVEADEEAHLDAP
jgi:Polyketide cyclase / dehydrase and lipid transport